MNKILTSFIFASCLVVLANASDQDESKSIVETEAEIASIIKTHFSDSNNRDRSMKKRIEKKSEKIRKLKNKTLKRKNNKKNLNKKANKKSKKGKGKKNGNKKFNKKSKKGNKMSKGETNTRNSKNKQNKMPMNKNRKKKGTNGVSSRSGSCMPETCIDTGVAYMKIMKDRVANFLSQKSRIVKYNQTSVNKAGKKSLFAPILNRLREAGGGNSSNLKCNGDNSNAGADQMANLTDSLTKCEEAIHSSCSTNLPTINITELDICTDSVKTFSSLTKECQLKKGAEACTCWSSSALVSSVKAVKECDLKTDNKKMTAAKKACTSAFGKCRKLEDEVAPVLSACSPANSKERVIADIKQGLKNQLAATKLSAKINSTLNAISRAASSLSCEQFILSVKEVTLDMIRAPLLMKTETKIYTLIEATVGACSDEEEAMLAAASADVDEASDVIDLTIESKQNDLLISTGTTVSIAAVNETITSESSTTSAATSPATTSEATMSAVTTTRATSRRGRKMFKGSNMKIW